VQTAEVNGIRRPRVSLYGKMADLCISILLVHLSMQFECGASRWHKYGMRVCVLAAYSSLVRYYVEHVLRRTWCTEKMVCYQVTIP